MQRAASMFSGIKIWMKRLLALLIAILIVCIIVIIGRNIIFPGYEEIETTGKYSVASMDYWVREDIADPFSKDGSIREIQVRLWYPEGLEAPEPDLPAVIASHGSAGTIDNNRTLYRELASHGCYVLAVCHPGHAFSALRSDGSRQGVSLGYLREMAGLDPQNRPEEAFAVFRKWMELRMHDLNAVMDDFRKRALEMSLHSDDIRFAVIGHSAGGSAALGIARTRGDVVGAIALEAPFLYDIKGVEDGNYIMDGSDYPVPIMNVYSDSGYPHLGEWKQYGNNVRFLDREDYANVHYEGIGHMGLCDLSLLSPLLARLLDGMKSTVPPEDALRRLNSDCLAFLKTLEKH